MHPSAALLWIRMPCRCTAAGHFCALREGKPCRLLRSADAAAFERTLRRLAHQILENNPDPGALILLVGILRRGVPLAEELAETHGAHSAASGRRSRRWISRCTATISTRARRSSRRCGRRSSPRRVAGKTVILGGRRYLHRPHGARRDGGRHPPRPPGTHPAGRDGRPRPPRAAHRPGVRRQERADGAGGADAAC